ncbi:hypothetical protein FO440_03985 [Mucilaginibacter corticis]|uniref:Uncharacterized protein n=1 Tax=Mucilaginibacter corticis TaxID=2597670 RepID=A0A556MTY4_9SPHI|nr:hypothetical protein [Mucilaginibacter corticis]TSJ43363.1 hypothetical protein FO440_03985 [Mucilaginibacter corticis]
MKANKKDVFKRVLKLAPADRPAADFTGSVMEMIEADAAREAALKSLLQQPTTEGPAFNFTASVMAQITAKNQPVIFKPIITPKAWYGIGAVAMLFLLLIGLSNSPAHTVTDQSRVADLLKQIDHLPSIYFMAIIAVGMLLFIDYLFTQRTSKTKAV